MWQTFLEAITGQENFPGSTVTDNEDKIVIRGPKQVIDRIKQTLHSPNDLKLPYVLLPGKSESTTPRIIESPNLIYPPAPELTANNAKVFLANLLGKSLVQLPEFIQDPTSNQLCLPINAENFRVSSDKAQSFTQLIIEQLQRTLVSSNTFSLWQFFTKNTPAPTLASTHKISEQNSKNIFCIREDAQQKPTLYFNYGLLYKLLFPPQIEEKNIPISSDDNDPKVGAVCEIEIDKQHLLFYLGQLVREGVVLKIVTSTEGEQIATPVFFRQISAAINKPLEIKLLIDVSKSMTNEDQKFTQYKHRLKELVKELQQRYAEANTKIELIPFGSYIEESLETNLSNISGIEQFINDLSCGGLTRLYGAIYHALSKFDKLANSILIVFTDGKNECDTTENDLAQLEKFYQDFLTMETFSLAPVTIGYGPQHDDKLMAILQQKLGSIPMTLDDLSPDKFAPVLHVLSQLNQARRIIEFVNAQGKVQRFPVFDGGLTIPEDASFKVGDSIIINNESYTLVAAESRPVVEEMPIAPPALVPAPSAYEDAPVAPLIPTSVSVLVAVFAMMVSQILQMQQGPADPAAQFRPS
ncbi:MAG: VWA domain-containing protein [Gammaproteobacteria bacterium]